MVSQDHDLSPADAAALHEGLAHPARVATMRALREARRMGLAELRRAVSETHRPVDTRTMTFHVRRMQKAGLVDVRRGPEGAVVTLLRDVSLKMRPVPPGA